MTMENKTTDAQRALEEFEATIGTGYAVGGTTAEVIRTALQAQIEAGEKVETRSLIKQVEAVEKCSRAIKDYNRIQKLRDISEEKDEHVFDNDFEIDSENAAIADILRNVETLIHAAQRTAALDDLVRRLEGALLNAKNALACGQHMYNKYANESWRVGYKTDLDKVKEALAAVDDFRKGE